MSTTAPYSASRSFRGRALTVRMVNPNPAACRGKASEGTYVLHMGMRDRVSNSENTPVLGSFVPATFDVSGLREQVTVRLGIVPVRPDAGRFAALQLTAIDCAAGLTTPDVPLELLRSLAVEASLFVGYVIPSEDIRRRAAKVRRMSKDAARQHALDSVVLGAFPRYRRIAPGLYSFTSRQHTVAVKGHPKDDKHRKRAADVAKRLHGSALTREQRLRAAAALAVNAPHGLTHAVPAAAFGWSERLARKWVQLSKTDPASKDLWQDKPSKQRKRGTKT